MAIFNTDTPARMADAIEQAVAALAAGQLVGLPTETVYGLAADASSPEAVRQVFALKGRPADHPLIVHVPVPFFDEVLDPRFRGDDDEEGGDDGSKSGYDESGRVEKRHSRESGNPENELIQASDQAWQAVMAPWVTHVPSQALSLIRAFWPGPLTLVLPKHPEVLDLVTGGQSTVALRCPSHPVAQAVLQGLAKQKLGQKQTRQQSGRQAAVGLAAPSANRFGHISPTTAQHVADEFGEALAVILDGGACSAGIESTIIDFSRGEPILLRPGALSASVIENLLGQPLRRQTRESLEGALGAGAERGIVNGMTNKKVTLASMPENEAIPRVSGHLDHHYSPSKPLWSIEADRIEPMMLHLLAGGKVRLLAKEFDAEIQEADPPFHPNRTAILTWSFKPSSLSGSGLSTWPASNIISLPDDPVAMAACLYQALRDADALDVDYILIESIANSSPDWEALRDRIGRAVRGEVYMKKVA